MLEEIKKEHYIKEIRIETYNGYFALEPFIEILKVSSNWISFKRYNPKEADNTQCVAWDYKTTNPKFLEKYQCLCEAIDLYNKKGDLDAADVSSFALIITLNNNKRNTYHFNCDVNAQKDIELRRIANIILEMIPVGEEYPSCLRHQEPADVNWAVIENIVKELEKKPQIDIVFPEECNQNMLQIGYPNYPRWVNTLIEESIFEPDLNYDKNYVRFFGNKKLEEINVDELDFDKLRTLITLLSRQEKFCDGFIAKYIENGCLLKWLNKALDLFTNE